MSMNILLLDGYVDEPALLGVPPYLSPYPRLLLGAAKAAFREDPGACDIDYMTIDSFRTDPGAARFPGRDLVIMISGALVPGKYLRGRPLDIKETGRVARQASRAGARTLLAGPLSGLPEFGSLGLADAFTYAPTGDADAYLHDLLIGKEVLPRRRTMGEWNDWSEMGAPVVSQHPDRDGPLIIELETYHGCVRYASGGCMFCKEPLEGKPVFREPAEIGREVAALAREGVSRFRIGGQSCIISYGTRELGKSETPMPNPAMVKDLLDSINNAAEDIRVLHVDNANPAVIAQHPVASAKVLEHLVDGCTSGNVLAFGLESADPVVHDRCNLNSTADQSLDAVRLVNEIGAARGESGLPMLLPGINFLFGLPGESKVTYEHDRKFLERVRDEGLLLRRINIRQVLPISRDLVTLPRIDVREFRRFKRWVHEEIDTHMLKAMLPAGTILRDVYTEMCRGNVTFGRQVGTYPLLTGIAHPFPPETFTDVAITGHGHRSVTGVAVPVDINSASRHWLEALPPISRKRAAGILLARPLENLDGLIGLMDMDRSQERELREVWGEMMSFR